MSSLYMQHRLALKNGTAIVKPKEQKAIAKVSEKKKQQLKEEKPKRDNQLEWFKDRVAEMKGECINCGCKINKDVFAFAVMTVAHCLPKRKEQFPSVADHKDNSMELCVENGCHQTYDRSWEDAAQMKCWPIALQKIINIYPSIAPGERHHLPDIIRQEIL